MNTSPNELVAIRDGESFVCPIDQCATKFSKIKSLQKHCQRQHACRVKARHGLTAEEKRDRQRGYVATFKAKNKKRTRAAKSSYQRTLYDIEDADARGVFKCADPILGYRESRIPNAGNGLFALEILLPGDIVTWYSGSRSAVPADDKSYTIAVDDGYINGLTIPLKNHGLGSFINRECRSISKCRKNCVFVESPGAPHPLYVEIIKKVHPGEELYTTYSRGYRIPRSRGL
jgi:hypothetical protein